MERREFLRISTGAVAGVVTGTVLLPLNISLSETIQQTTGRRTGNVGLVDILEEHCKSQNYSEEECFKEVKQIVEDQKLLFTLVGPTVEEVAFRAMPSLALSLANQEENPLSTTISGTGGLLLTRRELGVGLVSSILFAGIHSVTPRGFDTEASLIPGIISGSAFWYLQRKFGFLANTLAHITNNYIAVQLLRNM